MNSLHPYNGCHYTITPSQAHLPISAWCSGTLHKLKHQDGQVRERVGPALQASQADPRAPRTTRIDGVATVTGAAYIWTGDKRCSGTEYGVVPQARSH